MDGTTLVSCGTHRRYNPTRRYGYLLFSPILDATSVNKWLTSFQADIELSTVVNNIHTSDTIGPSNEIMLMINDLHACHNWIPRTKSARLAVDTDWRTISSWTMMLAPLLWLGSIKFNDIYVDGIVSIDRYVLKDHRDHRRRFYDRNCWLRIRWFYWISSMILSTWLVTIRQTSISSILFVWKWDVASDHQWLPLITLFFLPLWNGTWTDYHRSLTRWDKQKTAPVTRLFSLSFFWLKLNEIKIRLEWHNLIGWANDDIIHLILIWNLRFCGCIKWNICWFSKCIDSWWFLDDEFELRRASVAIESIHPNQWWLECVLPCIFFSS